MKRSERIALLLAFMACLTCGTPGAAWGQGSPIEIHQPGFTYDVLVGQLDNTTPRLEAIRNPDYGFGVVAASIENGILTVRRISNGVVEVLGAMSGFTAVDIVRQVRFDTTGLFNNRLFLSVSSSGLGGVTSDSHIIEIAPTGVLNEVAVFGGPENSLFFIFDFTGADHGYQAGAYLVDGDGNHGSSLWYMDADFQGTNLGQNVVPPGRTDMDIFGLQFDSTGVYDYRLILADCDANTDNWAVIYELLPDLSFVALTELVPTQTRCYQDLTISPGGAFGQIIYVTDAVSSTVMTVDPDGEHAVFASGFVGLESITASDNGENLFVSDANGVYRFRPSDTTLGPIIICQAPSVPADDVFTGPSGVSFAQFIFNEPILFNSADITITDEQNQAVPFTVSGSNSQFLLLSFGQPLLNDMYTITIADSVNSADTGEPIDGDNDGLAGGNAVIVLEHRNRHDSDNDGDTDLADYAELQQGFTGP